MRLDPIDTTAARLILQTSEGFVSQSPGAKARVWNGTLRPARAGHPLSAHLRGAGGAYKTKFCSFDDMASALAAVLATSRGAAVVAQLAPGSRGPEINVTLPRLYPIEAVLDGVPKVRAKFTTSELIAAGIRQTRCLAIVEDRVRGGREYLHVQTFYPKLESAQVWSLFDRKTQP